MNWGRSPHNVRSSTMTYPQKNKLAQLDCCSRMQACSPVQPRKTHKGISAGASPCKGAATHLHHHAGPWLKLALSPSQCLGSLLGLSRAAILARTLDHVQLACQGHKHRACCSCGGMLTYGHSDAVEAFQRLPGGRGHHLVQNSVRSKLDGCDGGHGPCIDLQQQAKCPQSTLRE